MSKHVLITGGAGFIGSHLTDVLLARDYDVTVFDSLVPQVHAEGERDADGWPTYLDHRVRRIHGDVLDAAAFEAALRDVTHLVHLAASVGVGQSMADIVDYTRNNVMGAAVMLETLSKRAHRIERVVVASSMSIYGEGAYRIPSTEAAIAPLPRTLAQLAARRWELELEHEALIPVPTAETKPLRPTSIYAINKRDHEEMFLAVGAALQIPTIALRLFNTYGSRQALSNPYTGVAAIFVSRLLNGQPPLIFEDGEQQRDFVHVADVAQAFATVLDSDAVVWDAFNVGTGMPITIVEVARVLMRALGTEIEPEFLGRYRVGDVRHCFADTSKFRQTFGFAPHRAFIDGAEELIASVGRFGKPADRLEAVVDELEQQRLLV
jgi:dTDP-L-rhamnose 4-epimerase